MGYSTDVIKGISWIGALRFLTRGISYIRIAILARLLSPTQFGLAGIASLLLIFIETITETGVNIFLIQRTDSIEKYINSAWIVSIVRGILISFLMIVFASSVAFFFNAPDAHGLILLISFVPFIKGFINPAIIKFQKELAFRKEFYFRAIIFFFDSLVVIVTAFITLSPVSIIYGLIAGALLEVILSFILIRPIPYFSFNFIYIKELFHTGKWVTVSGVFSYLFHNGDNIAVGRLLGPTALGFYDNAYRISMLPITEVADVISKVTFPVYTKISGDRKRLQKAFHKTLGVVLLLTIPFGAVFYLFPREIILFVLGPQWIPAVEVLKALAIFGVVRGAVGATSPLFLALKKERYVTLVTGWTFIVLLTTIIPLVNQFGIVGAAYSALFATCSAIPLAAYLLNRIFKKV